jgi:predicted phage terminase large subunit-like protein
MTAAALTAAVTAYVRGAQLAQVDPWRTAWSRESQQAPGGDWRVWLFMAGRGAGKTRAGAEWVREQVTKGGARRVALVAPTAADARDVMVQGESGILAVCRRYGVHATYKPSLRRVEFANGARAFLYSAEEPDRLRGPQHDAAWCDEIAAWRYAETWDQLAFGLRLGERPRVVATTTPKPVGIVRTLLAQAGDGRGDVVVTRGSTFDNAEHLAPSFLAALRDRYEGTRLGRQEIAGELLEDVEGALWSHALLDAHRVRVAPELARVVVAVDPAATHGEEADFTGIVAAGIDRAGEVYVLHAEQVRLSPAGWAARAWEVFDRHQADRLIYERNQGGEMVEHVLRTVRAGGPMTAVTATRGKTTRAEPVAARYEQGRVHHVGVLGDLEGQMTMFPVAAEHDDLVDALVWAVTGLVGGRDRTLWGFS